MANRNYANGRRREYEAIADLESRGYTAIRSAGSHGLWDVIAWNAFTTLYIQVKKDSKPSKDEWEAIRKAIIPFNGKKFVYIYRSRKPLDIVEVK